MANKTSEWSLQKKAKALFFKYSSKTFETRKIESTLNKASPMFLPKVIILILEFLSLQISQSSKVFLNSITLATDFF